MLLLYWEYIVKFAKILGMYHSWIRPLIILLYLPSPTFPGSFQRVSFFHFIHEHIIFSLIQPPQLLISAPYLTIIYLPFWGIGTTEIHHHWTDPVRTGLRVWELRNVDVTTSEEIIFSYYIQRAASLLSSKDTLHRLLYPNMQQA
jgi:hypothetical protein